MSSTDSIIADHPPVVSTHSPRVELSVIKGPGTGQKILLRRAASVIGSGPGCKLRLKHADVSRVHCLIANTGEVVFVRDLISRNGTFLNDLRAEHERLEDGDVIKIAPWHLQVAVIRPTAEQVGDFTGLGLDPSPAAIAIEDSRTKTVAKLPRDVSLLGRRPGCDFIIEDRSISRAHAAVFTYLSRVVVLDLVSNNGTKVNGKAVTFATLRTNHVLTLGSVDLTAKIIEPLAKVKSSGNGQAIAPPTPEGTYSDRIDLGSAELERR